MARLHREHIHTTDLWWIWHSTHRRILWLRSERGKCHERGVAKRRKENEFPDEELGFVVQSCNGRGEHNMSNEFHYCILVS